MASPVPHCTPSHIHHPSKKEIPRPVRQARRMEPGAMGGQRARRAAGTKNKRRQCEGTTRRLPTHLPTRNKQKLGHRLRNPSHTSCFEGLYSVHPPRLAGSWVGGKILEDLYSRPEYNPSQEHVAVATRASSEGFWAEDGVANGGVCAGRFEEMGWRQGEWVWCASVTVDAAMPEGQ